MTRKILFHPDAQGSLERIARGERRQAELIIKRISALEDEGANMVDVKMLAEKIFRARQGDYRIIFALAEERVIILKIERRNEATYRNLDLLTQRLRRMMDELDYLDKKG
jgi:mRNA-degrading endonuclease RelE of RelBE toxin-antitoxin system